ncbi:glycoside hydrolase family 88/105 protein [Plebeiibacterium sediminum]|uniref:Glycoside hydrolase family 88 protein n=1 Tax=Plebeiibacterium sediminum TaxID=2992112 RepID=A0AAE3M107_9BACT|nr:glycoside hydrolase family 88 protein [Plebeiobacterium sediminum]MCW3785249.1 glycoside hydrolase family 88 protein [Plebeiobacterium sediminum]
MNRMYLLLVVSVFLLACARKPQNISISKNYSQQDIVNIIVKVNDNWQKNNSYKGRAFWDHSAYHTGNLAAYEITKLEKYKNYSLAWANHNNWKGAMSDNKNLWKYSYGESPEYVLFGDWQSCFQTYIDLFNLSEKKDSFMIARSIEVMEYQMRTENNDYWWWADGLFMVMPVMVKLYHITGKNLYLDKLYQYYKYAHSIMYDEETGLFYRDGRYVYPKHKTTNGKKDFWARGEGWVFAGLAKTIQDLPDTYKHKNKFIEIYRKMAVTLKKTQQSEGYWTRSLLDPEYAPGPETSGTAFFTYGFLSGINNGCLNKEEYMPVVDKSWKYLTEVALQKDGGIGYVQPIGERAIPGQHVDENSTANFGVGAFLLAASEVFKFLENSKN